MIYTQIKVDRVGPICRIFHNRPEARNAETAVLLDEMDDAVRAAGEDADVRVVIIGGIGEHFSAGHDFRDAKKNRPSLTVEQRYEHETLRYFDYCLRIRDLPKPVIAQVQGACVSGAFMLANMCDLIVAADDAFFADPVVPLVGAAAVEVLIHPWVLGARKAKEFLFTGERVNADEALKWGMVNRVVPVAELESATLALANKIAQAPLFALMLTKRSINRTVDMQGQRTALLAHFDTHQLSHYSEAMKSLTNSTPEEKVARSRETMG
jgi:enoyl-CoA hydratase